MLSCSPHGWLHIVRLSIFIEWRFRHFYGTTHYFNFQHRLWNRSLSLNAPCRLHQCLLPAVSMSGGHLPQAHAVHRLERLDSAQTGAGLSNGDPFDGGIDSSPSDTETIVLPHKVVFPTRGLPLIEASGHSCHFAVPIRSYYLHIVACGYTSALESQLLLFKCLLVEDYNCICPRWSPEHMLSHYSR